MMECLGRLVNHVNVAFLNVPKKYLALKLVDPSIDQHLGVENYKMLFGNRGAKPSCESSINVLKLSRISIEVISFEKCQQSMKMPSFCGSLFSGKVCHLSLQQLVLLR